jgi:hypothetical protein
MAIVLATFLPLLLVGLSFGCASPNAPSGTSPAGSGNGVVNFRNASQFTFQSVCLTAAGTYDPSKNGNRTSIPSGMPICVSASMPPGTNIRIGADSEARFNPGPASLTLDSGVIFAVTIQSGTTNVVYPTSFQ